MIKYVKGDATLPQGQGDKILLHCVNNRNGWGKGFVTSIGRRWHDPIGGVGFSLPEYIYRDSFVERKRPLEKSFGPCTLGDVQFCPMPTDDGTSLWIANLVCQDGYKSESNPVPLSYIHLVKCLSEVENFLTGMKSLGTDLQVVCPKMGAGLAGGNWPEIEKLIAAYLPLRNVTVYEL